MSALRHSSHWKPLASCHQHLQTSSLALSLMLGHWQNWWAFAFSLSCWAWVPSWYWKPLLCGSTASGSLKTWWNFSQKLPHCSGSCGCSAACLWPAALTGGGMLMLFIRWAAFSYARSAHTSALVQLRWCILMSITSEWKSERSCHWGFLGESPSSWSREI